MRKLYCNHRADVNRIDSFFTNRGFERSGDDPDFLQIGDEEVLVFAHTGKREEWTEFARKRDKFELVIMSTQPPIEIPPGNQPANVHYLQYPADRLESQPRIQEFLEAWDRGERRWDLLERAPYPESLVAAYLVWVAEDEGVKISDEELPGGETFWKEAEREFEERKKPFPELNVTFDRAGVAELFRRVTAESRGR